MCAKSGCESSSREDMIPLRGRVRARGCLLCCTLYVVEAARREVLLTLCYLYMCSIILVDVVYMSYLGPRHVPVLLQHRVRVSQRASLTRASLTCVSVSRSKSSEMKVCVCYSYRQTALFLKSVLFTLGAPDCYVFGPAHNLGRRPVRPAWRPRSLHPRCLGLQTLCPSSRTLRWKRRERPSALQLTSALRLRSPPWSSGLACTMWARL